LETRKGGKRKALLTPLVVAGDGKNVLLEKKVPLESPADRVFSRPANGGIVEGGATEGVSREKTFAPKGTIVLQPGMNSGERHLPLIWKGRGGARVSFPKKGDVAGWGPDPSRWFHFVAKGGMTEVRKGGGASGVLAAWAPKKKKRIGARSPVRGNGTKGERVPAAGEASGCFHPGKKRIVCWAGG